MLEMPSTVVKKRVSAPRVPSPPTLVCWSRSRRFVATSGETREIWSMIGPTTFSVTPSAVTTELTMASSGTIESTVTASDPDASDTLSGVKSVKLQRRIGDGAWRDAGTRGTASSRVTLKRGQNNKFRVKATDGLGNKSTSKVVEARLTVRDSKSTQVLKPASGGWRTKAATKAYGGSLLLASNTTDSLVTSFYGKAVAVVGAIGPKRGSFRVRIDGGDWHTVSLKSAKAGHRRVVWSRRLEAGPHELEIQGLNGHTAIDAVLIIR